MLNKSFILFIKLHPNEEKALWQNLLSHFPLVTVTAKLLTLEAGAEAGWRLQDKKWPQCPTPIKNSCVPAGCCQRWLSPYLPLCRSEKLRLLTWRATAPVTRCQQNGRPRTEMCFFTKHGAALNRSEPCAKRMNNEAKKRSIKFSLSLSSRSSRQATGGGVMWPLSLVTGSLLPTTGEVKPVHAQRQWKRICAKSLRWIYFCQELHWWIFNLKNLWVTVWMNYGELLILITNYQWTLWMCRVGKQCVRSVCVCVWVCLLTSYFMTKTAPGTPGTPSRSCRLSFWNTLMVWQRDCFPVDSGKRSNPTLRQCNVSFATHLKPWRKRTYPKE